MIWLSEVDNAYQKVFIKFVNVDLPKLIESLDKVATITDYKLFPSDKELHLL